MNIRIGELSTQRVAEKDGNNNLLEQNWKIETSKYVFPIG